MKRIRQRGVRTRIERRVSLEPGEVGVLISFDDKVVGFDIEEGQDEVSPPTGTKGRPEETLIDERGCVATEKKVVEQGLSGRSVDVVVYSEQLGCHARARQKQREELSDGDRNERPL